VWRAHPVGTGCISFRPDNYCCTLRLFRSVSGGGGKNGTCRSGHSHRPLSAAGGARRSQCPC
jgi:hypothetical protein